MLPRLISRCWLALLVFLAIGLDAVTAAAAVLRVPEDYATIQEAVNAALEGDTILVGPGIYPEAVTTFEKAIQLRSTQGAGATFLDGAGTGIGFTAELSSGIVVEGFTIREYESGIRLWESDSVIQDCVFVGCSSSGLLLQGFNIARIDRSVFEDNPGSGVVDQTETGETAFFDCLFQRNGSSGARLESLDGDSQAEFQRCIFRSNSAASGGGIFMFQCGLRVFDCIFEDNIAMVEGGAIYWQDFFLKIHRSRFSNNSAGAAGGALAGRNSVVGFDDSLIANSLIKNNMAPVGSQIALLIGAPKQNDDFEVACSVVEGGSAAVHQEQGWTLVWHDTSNLQDAVVQFGAHISGDVLDLACSDDRWLRARSRFGFTSAQPNVLDVRIGSLATVQNPARIDITLEGRLNHANGSSRVRLRNWITNQFEQVHQFPIGTTEVVEQIPAVDPTNRVRPQDGRIELSLRQSVILVFSSAGFDSFTDFVLIEVEE